MAPCPSAVRQMSSISRVVGDLKKDMDSIRDLNRAMVNEVREEASHAFHHLPSPSVAFHRLPSPSVPFHRLPSPSHAFHQVREDSAKLKQAVEDMHKASQQPQVTPPGLEPWSATARQLPLPCSDGRPTFASLLRKSGGGMGFFPLAVCAQCLVVAALILYSGFGGGGGGKAKNKGYLD